MRYLKPSRSQYVRYKVNEIFGQPGREYWRGFDRCTCFDRAYLK